MKLDWYGDELYITNGSKTYELYFGSTGLQPQEGYFNGEEMNIDRVKQDKGVMLYTEYNIALDNIPEGHYDAVFTSRILDCRVDVMANFATIAKIEQRFEVDIDSRNTSKKEKGSVQISGKYPLTISDHENGGVYNIEKDLSGITVKSEAAFNATSIAVSVSYEFPEGWSEAEKNAFIYGGRDSGLHYEILVDGESLGKDGKNLHGRQGVINFEIPLTSDQQQKAGSIVLRPVYGWRDDNTEKKGVALEGCDIVIK